MSSQASDYKNIISTVEEGGKRKWIYAFQPKGIWYNRRKILSYFYVVLFFTLPFIKVNGYPLFQFNIPESTFILFGKVFLPHDFILLGIIMLTALVFIVVFTIVYGRVFCGWICPQTIFMEMIFRRIEYLIEGPAHKQIANKKKYGNKITGRKLLKYIAFFILSFIIANTFLAYIIGIDELFQIITSPISEHVGGFFAILGFTLIFFSVYAFVRELVCTVVCPYGRLQSVLMDKHTVAVAYDYNRGEPRNKKRIGDNIGDCIDCNMCVNVCPTGIDIRNGVQMECINCTACIDACNEMMIKTHKPINLISFASEAQLKENKPFTFTYRSKFFTGVLILLLGLMTYMILSRKMLDTTVMRVAGQIYQEQPEQGTITNLYKVRTISKAMKSKPISIKIQEENAKIEFVGKPVDSIQTGETIEETFFIKMKESDIKQRRNKLHVEIWSGNDKISTHEVSFLGKY